MALRFAVMTHILLGLSTWTQADEIDIYILTGQSNSLGTTVQEGENFGPGTHPADTQTAFFWSNPSAIGSSNPNTIVLHGDSEGMITTLQMQQGNGVSPKFWGPEFGLARTLFDSGNSNVMVIKISRGGGGNGYWQPKTGHMANHIMAQIDIALTAAQKAGHTFKVKGFMYLQGESNGTSEVSEADTRLQTLIDTVQTHINTNYSSAAASMYSVIGEIAASSTNTNRSTTTKLQKALAAGSQNVSFIQTHDLPLKSDNLHFGKDSKLQIGRRYADAFNSQDWVENRNLLAGYSANEGSAKVVPHPLAQGLSESGKTSGVTMQAVNDAGKPAWRIADNSPSGNLEYRQSLAAPDFPKMFAQGWRLKVTAKVVSGSGLALWSLTKENDPGWTITDDRNMNGFKLNRVNDDELEVGLWRGKQPINLGPGSANQFHTFELRGAVGSSLFDFYVNDQLRLAGVDLRSGTGLAGFDNALILNSGSEAGTGLEVYWNEVSLTVVSGDASDESNIDSGR